MRLHARLIVLIPLLLVLAAPAVAQQWRIPPSAVAACAHYENRARFKPRDHTVEFFTVLADACAHITRTALRAKPVSPEQARATEDYLTRLGEARDAIMAINRSRLAAPRPKRGLDGPQQRDLRLSLRLVSPSGEFLILREAGVFRALHRWAARDAGFTLAAALP